MKKIITAVIVVIVIAGGAYAIFHKSSKPASNSSSRSSTQSNVAPINNAVLITKTNSSVGQYLADPSGKTLYTYNADSNGVSNCTGSCLRAWPAYVDTGSTTNLPAGVSTIKRADNGQIQYTYNGLPLYFFEGDSGSGKVTGDGVQNFTVAKPAAATTSSSNSTSSSASPSTSPAASSNAPAAATPSRAGSTSYSSGSNW